MPQATLDNPLTLNPATARRVTIKETRANHAEGSLSVTYELRTPAGVVAETRQRKLMGAPIAAYLASQETALLQRVLAAEGVTGTIA